MQYRGLKTFDGGYTFVIIDELADLLLSPCGNRIKTTLQRILQIGRAAKCFVIACTQIPARKVLDAGLMLNFSVRIALRCNDKIESRQILGTDEACLLPRYGKCVIKGLKPQAFIQDIMLIEEQELKNRAWLMERGQNEHSVLNRARQLGIPI